MQIERCKSGTPEEDEEAYKEKGDRDSWLTAQYRIRFPRVFGKISSCRATGTLSGVSFKREKLHPQKVYGRRN